MKIEHGVSRLVFLTRRHAFKVPHPGAWKRLLWGLLANMQEVEMWRMASRGGLVGFCPVSLSLPLGLLVVMPRCSPLTDAQWDGLDPVAFANQNESASIPVEGKRSSFGVLNGGIVALDYG